MAGRRPRTRSGCVATTTILADLVAQVGGDRVTVESLVPKGGEVHTFDPTPSDIRRITEARLIVRNGLGLDDWLDGPDRRRRRRTAPELVVGEDLPGVHVPRAARRRAAVNPHLWLNVGIRALYADRIADDARGRWTRRTRPTTGAEPAAYDGVLDGARRRGHGSRLGAMPEANRTVISFHDAFPYFAAAYGLTIDGTIVDAPGQDPSAAQIAALVDARQAQGHPGDLRRGAVQRRASSQAIANETGRDGRVATCTRTRWATRPSTPTSG